MTLSQMYRSSTKHSPRPATWFAVLKLRAKLPRCRMAPQQIPAQDGGACSAWAVSGPLEPCTGSSRVPSRHLQTCVTSSTSGAPCRWSRICLRGQWQDRGRARGSLSQVLWTRALWQPKDAHMGSIWLCCACDGGEQARRRCVFRTRSRMGREYGAKWSLIHQRMAHAREEKKRVVVGEAST
jgi:hypothetical protein